MYPIRVIGLLVLGQDILIHIRPQVGQTHVKADTSAQTNAARNNDKTLYCFVVHLRER